jgi:RNA processing factor Prp31
MMPRCDIEELRRENAKLKEMVSYTPEEWNTMLRTVERNKEDIKTLKEYLGGSYQLIIERNIIIEKQKKDLIILANKLLEVKPELEEWVKLNFGEYL